MSRNIWILIPAYNEASIIGSVIHDLNYAGYENILVVNDGSKDNTQQAAETAGAEVLTLILNRGQGCALRTGLEFLKTSKKADFVVTFDGDGQHCSRDISKLLQPLFDDTTDIVLGSRFLNTENDIPRIRKIILKAGVLFTNFISNIRLTDTHNGLRALNRKALEEIEIVHRGMEHASDIIDEISIKKLRYQEIPVTILYTEYSQFKGQETSNFIKIAFRILFKRFFL